jgi:hypothetical protein
MSILETLQTDHRQVKELLKIILSTADAKSEATFSSSSEPS